MNKIVQNKKEIFCVNGFTIVELMVTLAVLVLVLGSLWAIFENQRRFFTASENIQFNTQNARVLFKLLENDFFHAGFGSNKNMAFYIEDNTQVSTSWADFLYFMDWRFLGGTEIELNNSGVAMITGGSGSQTLTLTTLNLDENSPLGKHKLLYSEYKENLLDVKAWTNYDNCYGDNCTDDCQNNTGKICSNNEFKGGIWQTVISDSPYQKVARIKNIIGNQLILDRTVVGNMLAPAIYYCLDQGANSRCDTNTNTAFVIKRSDRSSGGRQPLASDIVDFQIAYEDWDGQWYCDGTGPCPMVPFYVKNIKRIRISIISRDDASKNLNDIPKCTWVDKNNSTCKISDDNSSNITYCISIENGPPWGCDCKTKADLQKKYYISSYSFIPWNVTTEKVINNKD